MNILASTTLATTCHSYFVVHMIWYVNIVCLIFHLLGFSFGRSTGTGFGASSQSSSLFQAPQTSNAFGGQTFGGIVLCLCIMNSFFV